MPRIAASGSLEGYSTSLAVPATGYVAVSVTFTSETEGPGYDNFVLFLADFDPTSGEFSDYEYLASMLAGQETYQAATEAGQFLFLVVDVVYIDEGHSWSFVADITFLDTFPLFFDANDPGSFPITEVAGSVGVFDSTGPTKIYHDRASVGLQSGFGQPIRIDTSARVATLAAGDYTIVSVDGVSTSPGVVTLLDDGAGGDGPTISFDNAYISGNRFTLDVPLALGVAAITPDALKIDERGVVFGFIGELPDVIGGISFLADPSRDGDGVLTHDSQVVGPPEWQGDAVDEVVLLDLFRADADNVVVRWNAFEQEWRWTGDVTIKDLFGEGSRIALATHQGSHFYANALEAGLDFILTGKERATIGVGSATEPYTILLDIEALDGSGVTADSFDMTGALSWKLGRGLVRMPSVDFTVVVDTANFEADALEFHYENTPFSPVLVPTLFDGLYVTYFEGGLYALSSGDGVDSYFNADIVFDLVPTGGDPLLQFAADLTATSDDGLDGSGFLYATSLGGHALFNGAGSLSFDTSAATFAGDVTVDFFLPFLGGPLSFLAPMSFTQRAGHGGTFAMRGEAEITLPDILAALLGVTEPFDAEIEVGIFADQPGESYVQVLGELASAALGGGAAFGFRVYFDDTVELIGAVGFGEADPGGSGGGGGAGDDHFTITVPAQHLVLRAEGDVDADDVTVVSPGGARYALADFAARNIAIASDDATGITLVIADAEAGTWILEAPGATGFVGYADLPDLSLTVTGIASPDGPGLRASASWPGGAPAGGYTFRVFDDADDSGFDGNAVAHTFFDADGVFEIAFADLGLRPGEHFFHVEVSANGLTPAAVYLPDPVTITGVADLSIGGAFFLVQGPYPEGEEPTDPYPSLGITVTNEGTARAIAAVITVGNSAIAPIEIGDLDAGESVTLLMSLDGSVDFGTLYVTLDIANGGYEQDLADNSFDAPLIGLAVAGPNADTATVAEDAGDIIIVLTNDPGMDIATLAQAPRHGTAELVGQGVFLYTPDADFFGVDMFTYSATGPGGSGEASVWVTVTPVNDAPVLVTPIADAVVVVNHPLDVTPGAGAFADVDSDYFSYDLTTESGDPLPGWIAFDNTTGRITGTPGSGDLGSLALVLMIIDDGSLSASDSFVLRIEAPGGGTDAPDLLSGTTGADLILALAGDDTVNGRNGADTIEAGDGNDRVVGAAGNDRLSGGAQKDLLDGGVGNDTIEGGTERDALIGGAGADRFLFAHFGAADFDTIRDFAPGQDVIAISAAAFGGGLVAGMTLGAQFRTALTGASTTAAGTGQLVYETDTGRLWWDADGGGGSTQLVAKFAPIPGMALAASDLMVVA